MEKTEVIKRYLLILVKQKKYHKVIDELAKTGLYSDLTKQFLMELDSGKFTFEFEEHLKLAIVRVFTKKNPNFFYEDKFLNSKLLELIESHEIAQAFELLIKSNVKDYVYIPFILQFQRGKINYEYYERFKLLIFREFESTYTKLSTDTIEDKQNLKSQLFTLINKAEIFKFFNTVYTRVILLSMEIKDTLDSLRDEFINDNHDSFYYNRIKTFISELFPYNLESSKNENVLINDENLAQELIDFINDAKIDDFFLKLENLKIMDKDLKKLKQEFIFGKFGFEYYERLKIYIGYISQVHLNDKAIIPTKSVNLERELINMIDNLNISIFFDKLYNLGIVDPIITNLKNSYLTGESRYDIDYYDRLKVYVRSNDIIKSYNKAIQKAKNINSKELIDSGYQISPEGNIYLHEVKLIMLGNGRIGKSTVAKNLADTTYGVREEKSTVGLDDFSFSMNINKHDPDLQSEDFQELAIWENKENINFKFNVFDFGGQGKYRSVQHFFCSYQSLYLLLTSPDEDEHNQNEDYIGFSYWLPFIDAFGRNIGEENAKSPVLFVANKMDCFKENKDRILFFSKKVQEIDIENYHIVDFWSISCKNPADIIQLRKAIIKALPKVNNQIFEATFPISWMQVKDALEKEGETNNYITYSHYKEICKDFELGEDEERAWLSILNTKGNVIYFANNEHLKNIVILKPEWVRKAAYAILECESIIEEDGKFKKSDFIQIWKDSIAEEHEHLINLMLVFELCYLTKDNRDREIYKLPALFPEQAPNNFNQIFHNPSYILRFEYKNFIPAATLHKIMVRLNENIYNDTQWRYGVVFHDFQHNLIFISENWKERYLELQCKGENMSTLYWVICQTVEAINQKLLEEKGLIGIDFKVTAYNGEERKFEDLEKFEAKKVKKFAHFYNTDVVFDDKGQNNNSLENFINTLNKIIDNKGIGDLDKVFDMIRKSKYEYDKHNFKLLQNEFIAPMTSQNPVPFLARLKTFIGTLEEKE